MRNGLDQNECYRQCLVFLFAGGDTTASSLRGILMFTIITPRAYQSLKQTIRQAVASGDISSPITVAQAKRLPYLTVSGVPHPRTTQATFQFSYSLVVLNRPSYMKESG